MNKKLIALAVAGALAAPVIASAQGTNVTIFGRVQQEYSGTRTGNDGGTNPNGDAAYQGGLNDNARSSRWGLQISEDLGRGLKAIARLEQGMNVGGGTPNNAREQWVGLSSAQWGDVKFGRVQSPFKDFAGGMTIDPFAYTTLQANGAGATMSGSGNGMGSGANGFVNGAVRFDSIQTDGFSFAGLLMPGDANNFDPTKNLNPGSDTAVFGAGAGNTGGKNGEFDGQAAAKYAGNYMGAAYTVFGGYSRDNANDAQKAFAGVRTEETWRAGGTLKYDNLAIVGQFEQVRNAIGAATCTNGASQQAATLIAGGSGQCNSAMNLGGDGQIWHVGTNYQWGNTQLVAQGGATHADAVTVNSGGGTTGARDARSFTVGAIHALSKRTSLFGGYQRVTQGTTPGNDGSNDASGGGAAYTQGNRNTWTMGMRHNF
jgi:GBP family porin